MNYTKINDPKYASSLNCIVGCRIETEKGVVEISVKAGFTCSLASYELTSLAASTSNTGEVFQ